MRKQKICFIGACGHSKSAYLAARDREDVELCGIAPWSEHEGMTASFAPEIPFYSDARAMLDEVQPDLVVLSPVFALTGEAIIECARRGIDIFSEKPVASSVEELARVQKAVEESGVRFCAMHYLRYAPAFWHAAQAVRAGAIGEVRLITAQKSYRYGTRPAWYGDRSLYGGTIPWVGIHAIDWAYYFSGKRFLSVQALQYGRDPEMAALLQYRMEDGLMASINIDYYRPQAAPTHGDDRVRCAGTKGVVEVRGGKAYIIDAEGEREMALPETPELFTEFLEGRDPLSAEEIFHLTHAAIAAREAADSGKTVEIGAQR